MRHIDAVSAVSGRGPTTGWEQADIPNLSTSQQERRICCWPGSHVLSCKAWVDSPVGSLPSGPWSPRFQWQFLLHKFAHEQSAMDLLAREVLGKRSAADPLVQVLHAAQSSSRGHFKSERHVDNWGSRRPHACQTVIRHAHPRR